VYARDYDKRGYAQIRKAPMKQDPFKTDIFWKGLFTLRFPAFKKMHPDKWKEYEKLKIDYLEKSKDDIPPRERKSESKHKVIKTCKKLFEKGWTIKELSTHYEVTARTVKEWLAIAPD